MTGDEVKAVRQALGLTQSELGKALLLAGDDVGQTVRSWEKGRRPVTGPVAVALRYMAKFGLDRNIVTVAAAKRGPDGPRKAQKKAGGN